MAEYEYSLDTAATVDEGSHTILKSLLLHPTSTSKNKKFIHWTTTKLFLEITKYWQHGPFPITLNRKHAIRASLQKTWKSHGIPISTKITRMKTPVKGSERRTLRKQWKTCLDMWVLNKAKSKQGTKKSNLVTGNFVKCNKLLHNTVTRLVSL